MLLCCFCLQCMNVMIFVTNTLSGAIRINHHSWWSQKFRCQIKNSTVIEMKRIFFTCLLRPLITLGPLNYKIPLISLEMMNKPHRTCVKADEHPTALLGFVQCARSSQTA